MQCYQPRHIRRKHYYHDLHESKLQQVPCGKCAECCLNQSKDWFVRLKYELKRATSAYFFTLTYANPPISKNGNYTALPSELKRFIRALRFQESERMPLGKPTKNGKPRMIKVPNKQLSYFAVSEYGGRYQRPHFHILLFNAKSPRSVYKAWSINNKPLGIIHTGKIEDASINYLAGYLGKKIGIPQFDTDDRIPEFLHASKGLGDNFINTTGKFTKDQLAGFVHIEGKDYKLPRYLKNKIFPLYKAKTKDQHGNIKTTTKQHPAARAIGKKALHKYLQQQKKDIEAAGSETAYWHNLYSASIHRNSSSKKITPLS